MLTSRHGRFFRWVLRLMREVPEGWNRTTLFRSSKDVEAVPGGGGRVENAVLKRVTAQAEYWPLSPLW
ncbi:MAG: hypothetical protein ACYS47_00070 [Planctomycetota bacterium]|jgi:hypothetical protein